MNFGEMFMLNRKYFFKKKGKIKLTWEWQAYIKHTIKNIILLPSLVIQTCDLNRDIKILKGLLLCAKKTYY